MLLHALRKHPDEDYLSVRISLGGKGGDTHSMVFERKPGEFHVIRLKVGMEFQEFHTDTKYKSLDTQWLCIMGSLDKFRSNELTVDISTGGNRRPLGSCRTCW